MYNIYIINGITECMYIMMYIHSTYREYKVQYSYVSMSLCHNVIMYVYHNVIMYVCHNVIMYACHIECMSLCMYAIMYE